MNDDPSAPHTRGVTSEEHTPRSICPRSEQPLHQFAQLVVGVHSNLRPEAAQFCDIRLGSLVGSRDAPLALELLQKLKVFAHSISRVACGSLPEEVHCSTGRVARTGTWMKYCSERG